MLVTLVYFLRYVYIMYKSSAPVIADKLHLESKSARLCIGHTRSLSIIMSVVELRILCHLSLLNFLPIIQ